MLMKKEDDLGGDLIASGLSANLHQTLVIA
jgi:hypothetical protein